MVGKKHKSQSAVDRPVTLGELGKFTEEVIPPGVERIVEDKVDPVNGELRELRER